MAYLASQRELIQRVRNKVNAAIDDNSASRKSYSLAFNQFFQTPTGTEENGYPAIQSGDVNSMVTAVCAQMVISFSTDCVVEYEADSAQDEAESKAESQAVNKVCVEDNGGFSVMLGGIQNGLLYRNGYIKVWWDKDIDRQIMVWDEVPAEVVPSIVQDEPENGITRRYISYDPDKGRLRVEVTTTKARLKIAAVDNQRFFYDGEWNEPTLQGCPLSGEVHYKTRDDLVRMGVPKDKVDALHATQRYQGREMQKKRRGTGNSASQALGHQMDVIRVFEVWAYYAEKPDDDRADLHQCWLGETGDEWLLDPEIKARVPYAKGSAFPIANQFEGQSLAEKLGDVQTGKTELVRQLFANIRNCSWGQTVVLQNEVNATDVQNKKAGGTIRAKRLDAVMPLPSIDVGDSIIKGLDYLDKMRAERGGASIDMLRADLQLASETAHGTERVYASAELLVSYMTRNFAESLIREVYLLAHAEMRAGEGGPVNIKIAGQWQTVDPRQWKPRTHCNVTVGYSMGERMQMLQILGTVMQMYMQILPTTSGELTSLSGAFKLVTDYMKLGLVDNPESYFIDPSSPEAQQAGQQKQQGAQQQSAQANGLVMAIEQLKAIADKYKSDQDTGWKYFNTVFNGQIDLAKTETGGVVDVLKTASQAKIAGSANGGKPGGAAKGTNGGSAAGSGAKANGKSGSGGNGQSH